MINPGEKTGETGLEVAVIGMAGRFPGAGNIHEFWENLKNGVESVAFFTDEELSGAGIHPGQPGLPHYVKARGYLENIEYFDAAFFGYTPGEAAVMDPQLRFFHECAWGALEDAHCDPDTCEGLIGVYFGSSDNSGWKRRIEVTGGVGGARFAESLLSTTDLIATRLSYQLNLTGPSTTVNSACSTSLVAIHRACRGLLGGECDIALAGGVSITVPQKKGYVYREGMIDSPDGHCRAFDTRANGTLFGSGIGVVILKRLDEAVEDGNHIYAVIKGSAVNNDGKRKIGYTAPSVEGQGDVIRAAYQVAEVDPDSIGYIETHGTGTTLGDPIEIKALDRGMKRRSTGPCAIGAVKTNIGHLDAAAGAAGFIKTVLCLQHRLIPPTLHFNTPNPGLELAGTRFVVNTGLMEWERVDNRPLRAGVSSFGIGGTNAHVVLEEWRGVRRPDGQRRGGSPCPPPAVDEYQLILLSAKTATALDKMSQNLAGHLKIHPGMKLADVAYTLQKGRKAFVHRKALVCSRVEQAVAALSQPGDPAVQTLVANEEFRHTVFMFAGQGSQYVDMGLGLYREEPVFREEMDRCFDILKPLMGDDIKEILYPGSAPQRTQRAQRKELYNKTSASSAVSAVKIKLPDINKTEITQPIIFAFEYALAKLLMHWGITPDAVIGYSIGEYVAACLAGVFSLEDALALIVLRGQLMQELSTGAMSSVPLPEAELRPLLDDGVFIAIVNEPACIVAGETEAIERFESKMKRHRLMCVRLNTEIAGHTSIMDNAVKAFEARLRQIPLHEPRIPYISGITGDWINPGEAADYRYWIRYLRETIRFSRGIRRLVAEKRSIFIEIGPGRDLTVLVKRCIDKEAPQPVINLIRPSRKKAADVSYLLRQVGRLWLYRQEIDWKAFHPGPAEKRYLVPLPAYPFERNPYWIDEGSYRTFIKRVLDIRTGKSKTPGERAGIDHWFYLPSWKRTGIREIGEIPADSNRICLIFLRDDDGGAGGDTLGTGLIKRLKQKGVDTVTVTPGTGFACRSSDHYQLDPRQAGHYDVLLEELHKQNRVPGWIVHLWNVTGEKGPPELSVSRLENEQYYGFYSFVYLARAIGSRDIDGTLRVLSVSNHMQEVMAGDLGGPGKASLLGPLQVIPREYPNIRCRSVDIDMPLSGGRQQERLIGRLVTEMVMDTPEVVIAYRGNQRWVQVLEQPPEQPGGDPGAAVQGEIPVRGIHRRPELDVPYAAAENEIQQKLVHLWQKCFGLDRVGIDDDFFDLGGDSLKAMAVAFDIQGEFNVDVTLAEFFKRCTIRELAGYIGGSPDERNVYTAISPAEKKEYYPLSPAQKRLYILQQMEAGSIVYNETSVVELPRGVDGRGLEDTFRRLISRHESLRTSFLMVDDIPVQRVLPDVEFEIEYYSATGDTGDTGLRKHISAFVRSFDLASPPLVRVASIQTGEEKHILVVDMHHIIVDGRSQEIFVREFAGLYTGSEFSFLRIQYKDFVQWLTGDRMKASIKKQEVYWLKEFAGDIPCLDLPLDFSRPQVQNFAGRAFHFLLGPAETRALKRVASRENVTLFMLLLGLFNVLLSKLSGQEDVVVGTLIAGREHADLQSVIGMFANTLALRNFPVCHLTFLDFLIQLKKRALEAFENQDYPYEELVEQVVKARDTGRNPLFDVVFTYQPFQPGAAGQTARTGDSGYAPYESGIARFDMVLTALDTGKDLVFKWDYCTGLFKEESIGRFAGYFKTLVSSLLEESSQKISAIEIISELEKRQILVDFNDTGKDYPREKTICQLFEEQAAGNPGHMAVIGVDQLQITYGELNRASDRLACSLREKGVLADSIVGMMMHRSVEMIIGILGILKAGGAYLPIDPGYPPERIDYMLKDSNAKVLLKKSEIRISKHETNSNDLNSNDQNKIIPGIVLNFEHLDFEFVSDFEFRASNFKSGKAEPSNLAYVIYTSGTTGKPKGTLTTHANVVRVVKNSNYIDITPHDRLLQLSNYVFDGSVFDIYGALLNGAVLVMLKAGEVVDADRLAGIIQGQAVTCFFIATALFNTMVDLAIDCFQGVRKVLFGGETVSVPHVRKALAYLGKGRITHVYGPTETTVYATYYHVDRVGDKAGTIPIGGPISDTSVYILDKACKPVPIMVSGEVYIGGGGVARGYLNNPELTAERFVDYRSYRTYRTYRTYKTYRSYKTGDLARWLADGNIEFLGRGDHQVKIRGFRVELGEIEHRLLKHDGIKEALVTAREDVGGGKHLCAYMVSDNKPSVSHLRNDLAKELPAYMIPSYFVYLEAFPLTPGGKIDRGGLPAPEANAFGEYTAPRDEIEKKLVDIWAGILGLEKSAVGIDPGFFELGGNSLKAAVLKSRIHKELNVIVQLADIFKNPAIRGLSEHIRGAEVHEYTVIKAVEEKEFYQLSYNQGRLWILRQLDPESPAYNLTGVISFKHRVNAELIKKVLSAITARHESFRTYFALVNEEPVQLVAGAVEMPFEMRDISSLEPGLRIKRRMEIIDEVSRAPFNLEQAPLFRSMFINVDAETVDFVFNMDHIIADGWSMEVLKSEFIFLYETYEEQREIDPGRCEIRYKDFARWQEAQISNPVLKEEAQRYWQRKLSGELPELRLTRYVNETVNMAEFAAWNEKLKDVVLEKFNRAAVDMGVSTFMLFFSGLNILLARLSGEEDIVCGLLAAGREHASLQNIVGFFVNTLILKNRVNFADDFPGFLQRITRETLEALQYQWYPLELVFEELERKYPDIAVMFNMIAVDGPGPVEVQDAGGPYHLDQYPAGKFDLDFHVFEYKNGIDIRCIYRKRLFRREQMKYVLQQYLDLMEKIAGDPVKKIEDYFSSRKKRRVNLG
jgi:amino acid adenylation domain-containing protein